jgi:hypothetical protein
MHIATSEDHLLDTIEIKPEQLEDEEASLRLLQSLKIHNDAAMVQAL